MITQTNLTLNDDIMPLRTKVVYSGTTFNQ